jgi:hypothetical protein
MPRKKSKRSNRRRSSRFLRRSQRGKSPVETSDTHDVGVSGKKMCEGDVCCQAVTHHGTQCTRRARIKYDLTKGQTIKGIQIVPKTNCCFFCLQHFAIMSGYALYKIGWLLAESHLDWDEYISIHPEYLEQKMKDFSKAQDDDDL